MIEIISWAAQSEGFESLYDWPQIYIHILNLQTTVRAGQVINPMLLTSPVTSSI